MTASNTTRRVVLATVVALTASGCDRIKAALGIATPLDAATQQVAARRLVRAFAEDCLTAPDAEAATRALNAKGWPRFGVVWRLPDSVVFYAAKPSPAGLFVLGDRRIGAQATYALTCVGHYQADGPVRMLQAMRERWGADRDGPATYLGSRAWRFLQQDGALTPLPLEGAAGAPDLRAGQAVVYAQVSYQPAQHDVASLVSISRPAAASP